jgi:hypothetical protein
MTNDEITIAMAEVEGTHTAKRIKARWNPAMSDEEDAIQVTDRNGNTATYWSYASSVSMNFLPMPSYLTDANACLRVLKKWVDEGPRRSYRITCRKDRYVTELLYGSQFLFTVLSRELEPGACEAVLRAHGKWRDK